MSIVKTVTPAVSTTIFAMGVRDQTPGASSGLVHLGAHQPSALRYNTMAVAWDIEEMERLIWLLRQSSASVAQWSVSDKLKVKYCICIEVLSEAI